MQPIILLFSPDLGFRYTSPSQGITGVLPDFHSVTEGKITDSRKNSGYRQKLRLWGKIVLKYVVKRIAEILLDSHSHSLLAIRGQNRKTGQKNESMYKLVR